jgi:hypothetical protein
VGLKGELDRLAHQARPRPRHATRYARFMRQVQSADTDAYLFGAQILDMGGTLNLGAGGGPSIVGGGLGLGGSLGGMPRVGSMPRIPSAERLSKRLRDESPAAADSPRGFVPFRSLRSYENLLSLQAVRLRGSLCAASASRVLTRLFFSPRAAGADGHRRGRELGGRIAARRCSRGNQLSALCCTYLGREGSAGVGAPHGWG